MQLKLYKKIIQKQQVKAERDTHTKGGIDIVKPHSLVCCPDYACPSPCIYPGDVRLKSY